MYNYLGQNEQDQNDWQASTGVMPSNNPAPMTGSVSTTDNMNKLPQVPSSNLVGAQGPIAQPQEPTPSQFANPYLPAFQTQAKAISQQMLADQASARAQSQYAQMVQKEAQAVDDQYKQRLDANRQAIDQKIQEVEKISSEIRDQGAINPNRWWQEKGTGDKITASIAIALGGIGGAMMGSNRNFAMEQINRSIDLDIAAQEKQLASKKESLQSQQSLLGMYLKQTDDINAAKYLAKRDALGLAEMKLNETLAGVKSKEAQAKGLMLVGQLQQEKAKIDVGLMEKFQQQIQGQNIMSGKPIDPLKLPENMRDQVVKVGGEYKVALNKESAKEINQRIPVMDSMQSKINKIQELVDKNPYPFLKMPTKVKGELESLSDQLLLDIKDDRKLGALDKGSIEVARKIIGDPTAFFDSSNMARLKSLSTSIENDRQKILQQNVMGYQGLK